MMHDIAADESDLTGSQHLLWLGQRLHPESPLYNMVLLFDIAGAVDRVHFDRAWRALLARSDALRSIIIERDGLPHRRVLPPDACSIQHVDLVGATDAEGALHVWVGEQARRPFRLDVCLVHSALLRIHADRYVWYLNQHHLVTDGWSTALVYRRMAELYQLSRAGRLEAAAPFPLYAEWVRHERALRASPLFRRTRDHWDRKLAQPGTALRLYDTHIGQAGTATARVARDLGSERSRQLRELAAATSAGSLTAHTSLFNLFATAFFAYLHRVSGERRLAIGTPTHNRASAAFKETIGLFIEVFPFTAELAEDETFRSLLAKVQSETGLFLRYAQPGSSSAELNRSFHVLLNYIHASFPDFAGLPMRSEWVHAGHGDSHHHLRLQVHDFDTSGSFLLHFDFNCDLFDTDAREAAADHFLRVLDALLLDPSTRIAEVALLPVGHRPVVLPETMSAPAASLNGTTVVGMFERQAARTPDAIALQFGPHTLTYAALERRTRRLAHDLRSHGMGATACVGIYLPRSVEAVVGILGVLRAGAAYVPVSPLDPAVRTAFLLRDAEVGVVLTSSAVRDRLAGYDGRAMCIDGAEPDDVVTVHEPLPTPRAHDAAYVLYTSGSSGSPKGVVVEHESLARYVAWARSAYLRGEALAFPLFTSLSFDLTITSLFLPLTSGGRLVIYPEDDGGLPALLRVLDDDRVDVLKLTPSHLSLLHGIELRRTRVRSLILGGEDLRTGQARRARELFGDVDIWNEYGPTEATVGCMIHRFDPERDTDASVPIGRAAAGARIYLLDAGLNPVPPGVRGEIFIAGGGIARGYLNRPDLTAERFLPDPFQSGGRMYRTGDLGRRRADGLMQYLGRMDGQVKIRGARIETAEVEAALLEHHVISACAVDVIRQPARAGAEEVNCARCGLPAAYPGASFDAAGICHLCRGFDGYREKVRGYFRTMEDLQQVLARARAQRSGSHDCLMLLSGGKDSTYALYRLVELGLDVLAFTLDNGYISADAKANIRRVTNSLGVAHVFGSTPAMNAIFVDSLKRHSNVCNGCFKTLYTLGMRLARERGIPVVVTGLSRGQFFETRLTEELFREDACDVGRIDRVILEARKAYHRVDDAVAQLLDTREFRGDDVFEEVQFLDFYRYCDVGLDEMLAYLDEHAPWIRPRDTGRSTNCLINDVGIFVHQKERGYHNYAFPYSWDVRIGHKTRSAALDELNDRIDLRDVRRMLTEIGYEEALCAETPADAPLAAWYVSTLPLSAGELRAHLAARLPEHMLPSHFVHLEQLPLTAHGKVDRAALPAPAPDRPELAAIRIAPRGPVEERVAAIWADVLRVSHVGARDEFLELGGHSLAAIQVIARINAAFAVDLPLQSAFEASTVTALARLVEDTLLRQIDALSDDDVARLVKLDDAATRRVMPVAEGAEPASRSELHPSRGKSS